MEYMLMFYEPAHQFEQRKDRAASQPYWAAWMAYVQAMHQSGVVRSGAGLQEPGTGTTVRVVDGKRRVQDGPFADTKEQLGGFFVIDAHLDTALSWAQAPRARNRGVEVRPVAAAAPQGGAMTARAPRTPPRGRRDSTAFDRLLAARSHDIAGAEDALGDAFAAALANWPVDGVPESPEAWLLTVARRRLHDRWRHDRVEAGAEATLAIVFGELAATAEPQFPDERLKLMFVCAHPAIDPAARSALMLQTVLGLDAARIGSAFPVAPATLSTPGSAKPRFSAGIAFEVPGPDEWPGRLADVLEAIYAAYGTGWDDVAGTDPERSGLAHEALTLAAMLAHLVDDAAEAWGLLALLAFCQSRVGARRDSAGDYCRCSPDTALDRELLSGGVRCTRAALARRRVPARSGDQSAHTQPARPIVPHARSSRSTTPVSMSRRSRDRQPRLFRRSAEGPAAAALRGALLPAPRWLPSVLVRLAHLAAADGDDETAQAARERAVGLSTDPAVRRFLLREGQGR